VAHLDWADGAAKAPDKETSSPMPDRHLLSCAERVGRVAAESSGMVGIAGVRRPSDRRGRAIRARVPCRMLRDGNCTIEGARHGNGENARRAPLPSGLALSRRGQLHAGGLSTA